MCVEGMPLSAASVVCSLPRQRNGQSDAVPYQCGLPDGSAELNDSLHACHTALDLVIPLPGLLGRGEVTPVH